MTKPGTRYPAFLMLLGAAMALFSAGCGSGSKSTATDNSAVDYNPRIDATDFVDKIDSRYYPLTPGTIYVYESDTGNGKERNEVAVTGDKKKVLGIDCTVVHDRVWLDGNLVEETYDWYAQDKEGNVWYMGEDSKTYENGKVVSTEGSWEAGMDGAQPGYIMKAVPKVGDSWRQEYLKGEAEDMGEVIALGETISVPAGSYQGCVRTRDWTPLEPAIEENKVYCPGTGVVFEEMTKGGNDKTELVALEHV